MKRVLVIDAPEASTVRKMFNNNDWDTKMGPTNDLIPDLVCFVGGEDVSPFLYGEANNGLSHTNPIRDEREAKLFEQYKDIPKIGICRGGQFLNVMSGGKMIQHIEGHQMSLTSINRFHEDDSIWCKEDHHQAMVPTNKAELIAECDADGVIEACFYPETKSLCFQPHPEWGHKPTEQYFFELINRYFNL